MKEAKAVLKNCPTSPRKMRYVADMIRGLDVEKALNLVKFSNKHASADVEKLILSAIANWQAANEGSRIEDSEVYVKTIFVDGGRMLKRWLPAPQGRAYRKRKRSNHVTLILDSKLNTGSRLRQKHWKQQKKHRKRKRLKQQKQLLQKKTTKRQHQRKTNKF